MKLKLHHINLSTTNVGEMDQFYRQVLGLGEEDARFLPPINTESGVVGDVSFVTDGDIQVHLARRDVQTGFKTGHIVNPMSGGHIAYRTDDIEAFKKHLDESEIPYSDWGDKAVRGWHQVFFYDPDGNVIEVHQVDETDEKV